MLAPRYRFTSLIALLLLGQSSVVRAQAPVAPNAAAAELDPEAAFERARIYYESARYAVCVDAFSRLLERADRLDPKERASARTYLGACLIARGKLEEARQQFRQAILEDRQLEPPDPVVFPQSVVDVFISVRSSLMDALQRQQEEELQRGRQQAVEQRRREERERRRVAELERLAQLETVIRQNERWMAWVPFGIGQFHNDDATLGWVFLSAESVLAVTAITATSIELGLHSRAQDGRAPLDSEDLSAKVGAAREVGTIAWLTLIGVAAAGIIEANVSYRGELPVGQRKRALPDSLRPEASPKSGVRLTPVLGKNWVGVGGAF